MKIKKLRVLNLNSFRDEVVLNFGNTNFFVGRNASGKSNLIMVLNKMLQAQTNQILNIPPFDRTYSKSSIAECWINFDEEDISKFVSSEPYSYITSSLPSLAPDVNSFSQGLEHFAKSSKVEIVSSWSKGKQSISRNFITDNKLDMPVYQQGRGLTQRENAVSNLFSQFHVLIHNHILSKSIFV